MTVFKTFYKKQKPKTKTKTTWKSLAVTFAVCSIPRGLTALQLCDVPGDELWATWSLKTPVWAQVP